MSPLVLLGIFGTLISTVTVLPHLIRALRTKTPGGSPLAWGLGALGGAVWGAYGFASGDLLVAAPGVITIPAGTVLAVWSLRGEALPGSTVIPAPAITDFHGQVPATLELPAVA